MRGQANFRMHLEFEVGDEACVTDTTKRQRVLADVVADAPNTLELVSAAGNPLPATVTPCRIARLVAAANTDNSFLGCEIHFQIWDANQCDSITPPNPQGFPAYCGAVVPNFQPGETHSIDVQIRPGPAALLRCDVLWDGQSAPAYDPNDFSWWLATPSLIISSSFFNDANDMDTYMLTAYTSHFPAVAAGFGTERIVPTDYITNFLWTV